ncbi:MAG: demethoxyubiquinone hydroxylase family protein [Armatimonadota bacterium]
MPEFVNPFSGVTPDRTLTFGELTRAIRLSQAAELEAVHLYEAIADATDNALAAEVLRDIANEERVHAGEFQRLLSILLPDEDGFLAQGAQEVDEMAAGAGGQETEARAAAVEQSAQPEVPTIGALRSV